MQHLSDRRCEKPVSMRCHRCVMVATRTVGRARRAWPVRAVRWSGLQCSARRWFADGPLAHVRPPGGSTGPAQSLFRLDRSPPSPQLYPCLIRSNRRGTRSVCPVVWEGWCRDGGALRRADHPLGEGALRDGGPQGLRLPDQPDGGRIATCLGPDSCWCAFCAAVVGNRGKLSGESRVFSHSRVDLHGQSPLPRRGRGRDFGYFPGSVGDSGQAPDSQKWTRSVVGPAPFVSAAKFF